MGGRRVFRALQKVPQDDRPLCPLRAHLGRRRRNRRHHLQVPQACHHHPLRRLSRRARRRVCRPVGRLGLWLWLFCRLCPLSLGPRCPCSCRHLSLFPLRCDGLVCLLPKLLCILNSALRVCAHHECARLG